MERLAWLDWPLILKSMLVGMGLGMIYGVATRQFVFGITLGLVTGLGFGVGRSWDTG